MCLGVPVPAAAELSSPPSSGVGLAVGASEAIAVGPGWRHLNTKGLFRDSVAGRMANDPIQWHRGIGGTGLPGCQVEMYKS